MLPLQSEALLVYLFALQGHAASRLHLTTAFGGASPQGEANNVIPHSLYTYHLKGKI